MYFSSPIDCLALRTLQCAHQDHQPHLGDTRDLQVLYIRPHEDTYSFDARPIIFVLGNSRRFKKKIDPKATENNLMILIVPRTYSGTPHAQIWVGNQEEISFLQHK